MQYLVCLVCVVLQVLRCDVTVKNLSSVDRVKKQGGRHNLVSILYIYSL